MDNYEDMIKTIEEYYGGRYNLLVKNLLLEYLKKKIRINEIKKVFSMLIKKFSNKYKIPPDIAVFEEVLDERFYEDRRFAISEMKTMKYLEDFESHKKKVEEEQTIEELEEKRKKQFKEMREIFNK